MHTPSDISKIYSQAGAKKTNTPALKLFVLAIFAGAFIALGAFGSQSVAVSIGQASLGKFLGSLVFPVGLLMVIVAGGELFTGNSLIIISVLDKKAKLTGMLKNWIIVYIGNFVGSMLIVLLLAYGHMFSMYNNELANVAVNAAASKCSLSFQDAILRGILCNILVCISVWISFSAEDAGGKILGLFLPIMLFVVSGYEHCVANMYFVPAGIVVSGNYGIVADGLSWGSFLLNNLLPVTIGNVIGGACMVGIGYYYSYLSGSKS